MPPAAIIKFGTTSTTLLVAERLEEPVIRQQQLVDLFDPQGADKLLKLAQLWRGELQRLGASALAAGGEGIRRNPELERRLQTIFPNWWHLSGAAEGRLAWTAVKARHADCDGVIDIGGGSTEIITMREVFTYPAGAARSSSTKTPTWPDLGTIRQPVFVGGTAVALARWVGNWTVDAGQVPAMLRALEQTPEHFQHLDELRRRILPAGLALMQKILEHGAWHRFLVSSRGLTEGLWLAASLGRMESQ